VSESPANWAVRAETNSMSSAQSSHPLGVLMIDRLDAGPDDLDVLPRHRLLPLVLLHGEPEVGQRAVGVVVEDQLRHLAVANVD
jgi:hypothetical protein